MKPGVNPKKTPCSKEQPAPRKAVEILGPALPDKFRNKEWSMCREFIVFLTCEGHFVPPYIFRYLVVARMGPEKIDVQILKN